MQPKLFLTLESFLWSFCPQVRHRWCELVVKHTHAKAYGDVEHFLVHDQVNMPVLVSMHDNVSC